MANANKEKYLWEIYINVMEHGFVRVSQIAKALNVTMSSASKMAKKLATEELIEFQRYGNITLTEKGMEVGKQLAKNHDVLARFFQHIHVEEDMIEEEVNKIEFSISRDAIEKIDVFLNRYKSS